MPTVQVRVFFVKAPILSTFFICARAIICGCIVITYVITILPYYIAISFEGRSNIFDFLMTPEQLSLRDEARELVKRVPRQYVLNRDAGE